jgi:hypothetical protein
VNAALDNAIKSGEFTLLGVAADDHVGYDANTINETLGPSNLTLTAAANSVPEPATMLIFGSGLASLAACKKKPDYVLPSVTKHLLADRKFCVVS